MASLWTALLLFNAVVFICISIFITFRVREAVGSLKPVKASIVLATAFAAGGFIMEILIPLCSSDLLLAEQLFVFDNLFAMIVVASLSSFAWLATYGGPRRGLVVVLFYLMAFAPPFYLAFTYDQLNFVFVGPGLYEATLPELGLILFVVFGVPLGAFPVLVLARSLANARKSRDKALTQRVTLLLSAVTFNLVLLAIYVFGDINLQMDALLAWIPAALLLLLSFLRTAAPIEPNSKT